MKKLRLLAAFALLAAGMAAEFAMTSVATGQSDNLIVPGERVGPIRLEMYREDVIKVLGKPNTSKMVSDMPFRKNGEGAVGTVCMDDWVYGKKAKNRYRMLEIAYSEPPCKVDSIEVTNLDQYATAEGIRTGSSVLDVLRVYGAPNRKRCSGEEYCQMFYTDKGIMFGYRPLNNEVFRIFVNVFTQ